MGGEDFAGEEGDWSTDQASAAKKPETIHEAEERGLLKDKTSELRLGVERRVGNGVTTREKIVGQRI